MERKGLAFFVFIYLIWVSASPLFGEANSPLPPLVPDHQRCAVSLAGYGPAIADRLEGAQQKAHHTTQAGRSIYEYECQSSELTELNFRLLEALSLANRRFNETRPGLPDLVFSRQKKVVASQTRYFVLRGAQDEARGMGMLIEGNQGVPLPIELQFPVQDFRSRQGSPRRVVELARLATHEKENRGLRHLFEAMAVRITAVYGRPVPEDLDVILWTSLSELTGVYRDKYGFEVWRSSAELDCAECSVLGLSARAFVEKYAPRGPH